MRSVCPPPKKKVSVLISLIFTSISLSTYAYEITGENKSFDWPNGNNFTCEELNIDITPVIKGNYYTIDASNGKTFTVNKKTVVSSVSNNYVDDWDPIAVYNFHAQGSGVINLNGDVEAISLENVRIPDEVSYAGVNLFYAKEGGTINIGSPGSTVKAWAIGKKPDLISAKVGGKVQIASTNNQLIGNIDTLGTDFGSKGSTITGTFSGANSFWFGDEQTFQNFENITISASVGPITIPIEINSKEKLNKLLNREFDELLPDWLGDQYKATAEEMINNILDNKLQIDKGSQVSDKIELTFENGAQWTYFGDKQILTESRDDVGASAVFESTPKRISAITLNRGIINLYDEDIRRTWEKIGLTDKWSDVKNINHDYVRIGNLKGNGGIFRLDLKLDLNSDDPPQSDMIFIESSSDGGQHFIEPYRPEDLTSVSDTNRLTFALTAEGANSVSFADKQNIYGNSLFDYELIIGHEKITINEDDEDDKDLIKKINEALVGIYKDFDDFNIVDYNGGTHWYIKRLLTKESAASIGMRSAGYASYDLAVNMDRRDRRLQNAVFQNEEKDGLWARVQYGEAGAEHLYNADLTTVYVGYEKATSADNRLGFSFAYTDGESDLNDLKGSGDLKRYEASVYDTLTFGSHYLDFVARFGQVDNEFDVTNQSGALTTSGLFDQKYAALSAEYGYNFKDEHNVFIEPQVQLQVAYLGDYNYRTERNMKVDADSDISVIGRVGLRTGKTFESSDYVGELYARADVLHQFTDGQDAQFSDLSDKVNVTWGNKDTWSTFGVGGYLNWKDNVSFQVDVERTAGGETIDTWLVSGRVNYLF